MVTVLITLLLISYVVVADCVIVFEFVSKLLDQLGAVTYEILAQSSAQTILGLQ